MALSNRIKIILGPVDVLRESPQWGPSEWSFRATVAGQSVGKSSARFPANIRDIIFLPEATWSHIVDISARDSVDITFSGTAIAESGNHDLGRIRRVLRMFGEQEIQVSNRFFSLTIRVEVEIKGLFGHHMDDAIYACRAMGNRTIWTTASGRRMVARLEFCEVRPAMGDWAMPRRPNQPAGAGPEVRNGQGRRTIDPLLDPVNYIHNPPVIPMLTSAEANEDTAACIEWTYYRPQALQFSDKDDRLRWTSMPVAATGGDVRFVGGDRGRTVYVRGEHEGEVQLVCRMEGVVLATYRALVRRIRDVPCRFNILNGPPGSQPRSTPEDVLNHMQVANVFLRQLGLQLALDTDPSVTDGATPTAIPGIFRISVPAGRTVNVQGNYPTCTRLNYRPNVVNITYIHSDFWTVPNPNPLLPPIPQHGFGMTSDFSGNTLVGPPPNHRVADNGTPSTSWIRPSGIPPDGAARTVRMSVFRGIQRRNGHPQLFAFYVTNLSGNPASENGRLTYGGTIVHELGHILTLRHRIGAGNDGLGIPPRSNVMHGTNPSTLAQDFDIIQARAVLGCPVVRP